MTELVSVLHYGFLVRGVTAGFILALVAPLIGIFLVLRRYALIADTLAHVGFAGVSLGVLFGINPLLTTVGTTLLSSVVLDRLRVSRRISGDAALSLFLSGSLAFAIVLLSLHRGFRVNLQSYLFGSIVTVTTADLVVIALLGVIVTGVVLTLLEPLVTLSFDEDVARVAGIPVTALNTLFIALTALTIALAIPIVGVLLISALMIIPVLAALQFHRGFVGTLILAEGFSVLAVVVGMLASFAFNLSSGGSIVLVALGLFLVSLWLNRRS